MSAVEREAGPDLAELRILNETPSNESGLRRQAGEIETELRTYRGSVNSNQELLKLLPAALDDPGRLLASPGRLLESQPALRRLKDGLVDAQLRTAQLLGNMSEDHPAVAAARASEQEISQQLHDEISIAIKGLEVDLRLANERVDRLEEQRKNVQGRLVHLAAIRAEYSNLIATVAHSRRDPENRRARTGRSPCRPGRRPHCQPDHARRQSRSRQPAGRAGQNDHYAGRHDGWVVGRCRNRIFDGRARGGCSTRAAGAAPIANVRD